MTYNKCVICGKEDLDDRFVEFMEFKKRPICKACWVQIGMKKGEG